MTNRSRPARGTVLRTLLAILSLAYLGTGEPVLAQSIGSGLNATEGPAITPITSPQTDTLWADSSHRWMMANQFSAGRYVSFWPCFNSSGCIVYSGGTAEGTIFPETALPIGATPGAPLLVNSMGTAPQWGGVNLLGITALSNTTNATKLATAASTVPTNGNLASWDTNKNVADSGTTPCLIQGANAGFLVPPYIFLPSSVGNGTVLETTLNVVKFVQFYLPCKTTISHVSAYISASSSGSAVFGFYNCGQAACTSSSPLVAGTSVALSCATANVVVTGNTSPANLTLLPGVYAFAYGATDTTCAVISQGSSNWMSILNQNSSKRMAPAGTISGATMSNTLGTIGTPAAQAIPFTLWEP